MTRGAHWLLVLTLLPAGNALARPAAKGAASASKARPAEPPPPPPPAAAQPAPAAGAAAAEKAPEKTEPTPQTPPASDATGAAGTPPINTEAKAPSPAPVVPDLSAIPPHWPVVPYKPGRKLPSFATVYKPRLDANTLDGKVWTSTLYTVSQPLNVEWGYGQIGAQLDADSLFGSPVGFHVDGFFQQRLYHRPLRLQPNGPIFGPEAYTGLGGLGGVAHPRYQTYDRLTEANVSVKTKYVDLYFGRTIVPSAFQSMVDGVAGSVAIMDWGRAGGWAGMMPEQWHPRLWLDRDIRSLGGFFPGTGNQAYVNDPMTGYFSALSDDPLALIKDPLNAQTVFNMRYATVGGFFSTRFNKFTSDTAVQLIFWNPTSVVSIGRDNALPQGGPSSLGFTPDLPVRLVDAAYVHHLMTFRPLKPLNFHLRGTWDAYGAMRSIDLTRAGNPSDAFKVPQPGGGGITGLREMQFPALQTLEPLMDSTGGIRELLGDVTFRGDWPLGLSAQLHHFQSMVTAQSYRFYQSDLVQPGAQDQFWAAQVRDPSQVPSWQQLGLMDSKRWNMSKLGIVQRERFRVNGWVSPLGFIWPDSSAQFYGEAYVEWRRDYPRLRPETDAACTLDRTGGPNGEPDGIPEPYFSRKDCRVCQVDSNQRDAQGNPIVETRYGDECGNIGGDRIARQDDYVRVGATVGLRDPTLYDSVTYDFSVTGVDGWHNRAIIARARLGAQAFEQLFMDLGFTYELSQNQRYFTSDVRYNGAGAGTTINGIYPKSVLGQAFVFDANMMFRVAYGLTFEASYMLFFEEAPNVQDFVLDYRRNLDPASQIWRDTNAPAGVVGYIPRDQYQAQQLFLLRASYRL
jgi:hypothetical protein